jgi:hypothetical protein
LDSRNNLSETEGQQVARYIGGLRMAIQDQVSLHTVWTLSEALNLAMKIESQMARHSGRSQAFRQSKKKGESTIVLNPQQSSQPRRFQGESSNTQQGKEYPFPLGKRELAEVVTTHTPSLFSVNVFRCGQPGHISNECSSRRLVNTVESAK